MLTNFPKKNPDIVVDPAVGEHCVLNNTVSKKYFRLGAREANFLASLDGMVSATDLAEKNCSGFTGPEVAALLCKFEEFKLTGVSPTDTAVPVQVSVARKIVQSISDPGNVRFHLIDPNAFLDRHIGGVHALFSRAAMSVYLLVIALPVLLIIALPSLLSSAAAAMNTTFSPFQWAGLYGAILVTIGLHELAHAAACKHFGGTVHKIGVMLLYMQPVVYCDISESWRFDSVEKKLTTAFAGIFLQLLISSVVVAIWAATGEPILLLYAVANAAIAFFNFFPFIKLDGYWMLVHVLDEPNLRHKSFVEVIRATRLKRQGAPAIKPALLLFGLASIAAALLFAGLSLYTIHKYLAYVSEYLSLGVTGLVAAILIYRSALNTRRLVSST